MVDQRFFRRIAPHRLNEIVDLVGASIMGDAVAEIAVSDVAPLETADGTQISLFFDRKAVAAFRETAAAAVVTSSDLATYAVGDKPLLIVTRPRLAFLQICELFYPRPLLKAHIDKAARIDKRAQLGLGCRVDAGAIVGPRVEVGAGSHISHGAVIGEGVVLGDHCEIGANAVVTHALIGSNVRIGSGVAIGKPGFGFAEGRHGLVRVAHLARVVIEDAVEVGANCTIDRGVLTDTFIGAGTKLDNMVHVAHSVRIGRHCAIAGQVGIAGSTVVGDQVMIGGQAGISDHLTIGGHARIAAGSGVIRDVANGEAVGGYPAMPIRQWHRQSHQMRQRSTIDSKED